MNGKTEEEAEKELEDQGIPAEHMAKLLPYKVFAGNKPTNSILSLCEFPPRYSSQEAPHEN